jgi:hypothetical protein
MTENYTETNNKNFLSPLGYMFKVNRTPNTNFFVTQVILPGVNVGNIEYPTPFKRIAVAGDKMEFNDLLVTFKVDEDMNNYLELFEWIRSYGTPESFEQYKGVPYSDATLTVLNSFSRPNLEFTFQDLFPVNLTDLQFSSNSTDVEYIECSVTFKYRQYTYRKRPL